MKLVTATQMQALDRQTIDGGHVPSLDLMENAGCRAADVALSILAEVDTGWLGELPKVVVVCGKGNNGGDGLVMARRLAERDVSVTVLATHEADELSPDARDNFQRLPEEVEWLVLPPEIGDPGPVSASHQRLRRPAPLPPSSSEWIQKIREASLCIDALLGTGSERNVEGRLAALINSVNRNSVFTLAVDIPSGVDGNDGRILGTSIWADVTVTLGLPKRGLVWQPGRERCGEIMTVDIGFPPALLEAIENQQEYFDATEAQALLPGIDPRAHKYQRGVVLVIAGSRNYPGAAVLCARGAQRCGAGLVHLAVPFCIRDLVEAQLPEVIVHGLDSNDNGGFSRNAWAALDEVLDKASALAVGPGVGRSAETLDSLRQFLDGVQPPAVIDADALQALPDGHAEAPRILTPHTGELARLLEEETGEREDQARRLAEQTRSIVLAKGAPSLVVAPDDRPVSINATGSVALATGGTGDVLTGILGTLLAQGLPAWDAARLGAYLHGAAADIFTRTRAHRSFVASDLPEALAEVLKELGD